MRCGSDLDWQDWYGSSIWSFGAKPIAECADTSGFGPPAESLSLVWPRESNQREGHPDIRPRLCRGSLLPVLLRGPSRRDVPVPSFLARRPCLASPCSRPAFGLLKGKRLELPDGWALSVENALRFSTLRLPGSDCRSIRPRRFAPSGGRAEVSRRGLSGMDAARAAMGHGRPFAACPWSGAGAREPRRSRGRMQGQAFLLT